MTERFIDLNADVGEGVGDDAALIPLVTSASIACGAHAGDAQTMAEAVRLALAAGVAIGAHPGHADREHFGRRELPTTPTGLSRLIADQLAALQETAAAGGGRVRYVKLHGALYHQVERDRALAAAAAETIRRSDPRLAVLGKPGGALAAAAADAGLAAAAEGFVDRAYLGAGELADRTRDGAVLLDASAVRQAVGLAVRGEAPTLDGGVVRLRCDSLCLHGDSPAAATRAAAVRAALAAAGVGVRSFAAPDGGC